MKSHGLIMIFLIFFGFISTTVVESKISLNDDCQKLRRNHSHQSDCPGAEDSTEHTATFKIYNKNSGKWITKYFTRKVNLAGKIDDQDSSKSFEKGIDKHDIKVGQRVENWGEISGPEECARECISGEQPKICYYAWTVEQYRTLGRVCDSCVPKTNSSLSTDCQCIYGDGYNISGITTVNRMFPGPSVQVCVGDLVVVDVTNNIDGNQLTIHWHGIYQHNWQHYDGAPFVTQCPIPSKTTFRYQWRAQNIGTHWWHSHTGMQQAKMLEGMIVIREPKEDDPNNQLYDRDDVDNHIFLSDWMHTLPEQHFPGAAGPPITGQRPDNILINGQGQWLNPATGAFTNTPLAVITVEPGVRYRFRMVNTASWNCPMQFTVQDHNLTIIATDGESIEPVVVNTFTSFPAERFDFILNANQQPGVYWIQVRMVGFCADEEIIQFGILRYTNSNATQPDSSRPTYNQPITTGVVLNALGEVCDGSNIGTICIKNLQASDPVDPRILAEKTDYQFFLPFNFYSYNGKELYKPGVYKPFLDPLGTFTGIFPSSVTGLIPIINGITNLLPTSPLLTQSKNIPQSQICQESTKPRNCLNNLICECAHILRVPLNSSVELIMYDEDRTDNLWHPFHLHGYGFHVMAQGSQDKVKITPENKHKALQLDREKYKFNLHDRPPVKDTLAVPSNGYTIVRFIANNPGYWFYHCHILPHLMTGMSLVIQVGDESDVPPRPPGFPTCGNYQPPISSSFLL